MAKAMEKFALAILGGGSGGLAAAKAASKYRMNACLIESGKFGGVCLNAGCIPKKLIYNSILMHEEAKHGDEFGINFGDLGINWLKIKENRERYIAGESQKYENTIKDIGIPIIKGRAHFLEDKVLRIENPETHEKTDIKAENIIISTGGRCLKPEKGIPGITQCLGSDQFFNLTNLPKSIFIIGGGYIGVEIANTLAAFNIQTTIGMAETHVVPPFDEDITTLLMDEMGKRGINIMPSASVVKVEKLDKKFRVHFKKPEKFPPIDADKVLAAIGISPNIEDLHLENTSIQKLPSGHIKVDEYEETSVPGVFAVGDVNGKIILTPVARVCAEHCVHNIFYPNKKRKTNYDLIPSVCFSHPPMGKVGLTEKQAIAKYGADNVKVYKKYFVPLYSSILKDKHESLVKLVFTEPNNKLVGVHLIGRGLDEALQGFAVAIKMGATKDDLAETLSIHPTDSEELINVLNE